MKKHNQKTTTNNTQENQYKTETKKTSSYNQREKYTHKCILQFVILTSYFWIFTNNTNFYTKSEESNKL